MKSKESGSIQSKTPTKMRADGRVIEDKSTCSKTGLCAQGPVSVGLTELAFRVTPASNPNTNTSVPVLKTPDSTGILVHPTRHAVLTLVPSLNTITALSKFEPKNSHLVT